MYLFVKGKKYIISLIPALFMTYMVLVYILNAQIGLRLDLNVSFIVGAILTVAFTVWFFWTAHKNKKAGLEVDINVESIDTKVS